MVNNREIQIIRERDWTESEISILKIMKSSNGRGDLERIKDTITPIAIRAYLYKNNKIEEFTKYDINTYNNMVDEISDKLKINKNLLKKIDDHIFLEFIKDELTKLELDENLKPINTEYYQIIEDHIRRLSIRYMNELTKAEKLTISSRNMANTMALLIKELGIDSDCIELGSGAGCILRRLEYKNIKGIEINKNLADISKSLNFISGKDNIEIIVGDSLEINETQKYSLTIVETPGYKKVESEKYKNTYKVAREVRNVNLSDLLLEKSINITKEGGYIVGVVNDSILYAEPQNRIRKLILDKTIIKAIISLPDHIQKPFSAINKSLIIMKKKSFDTEKGESFYVNIINKIEEINTCYKEFSQYINIENASKNTNTLNYETLYKSSNWCANYLTMFNNLNSSNRYSLDKICQINTKTLKNLKKTKEIYPYIEVKSIDKDNKILKDINKITYDEAIKKYKGSLIAYPGDIVISTTRPKHAALAIVPMTSDVYIVSNTLAVLTPKNITSELLYFMLCKKQVAQEFEALAKGYAVDKISPKDLKEYKLPITNIPYEKEQEAKDLYEKITLKCEKYKPLNQIIEEELKIVKEIENKQYEIDEIITHKKSIIQTHEIKINQVKVGNLDAENIYAKEFNNETVDKKSSRHNLINSKDVLIPRELNLLQRTSVASETIEGCISNYNINVYSVNNKALPEYIAMLFRSKEIYETLKSYITEKDKENINQKDKIKYKEKYKEKDKPMLIKKNDIDMLTIKLPSIEIQKKLVDKIINKSKELSLSEINLKRDIFINKYM